MIEGIRFNDQSDANRIAKISGVSFNPLVDQCIARFERRGGTLLGGVVYKDWTGLGGSIAVHVAGLRDRWVNRALLFVCFDYPFNQLQVKKIFGQISSRNRVAYEAAKHLGFVEEARIRDVYPDGDMVLLSMTREQCRFLEMPPSFTREQS
jgi:RimJ/RimL family protein N-acetyltransferase